VLIRFTLPSPVTVSDLCLTIVWPDSGCCFACVVALPSNAVGGMSRDPVSHLGPDDVDAYPLLSTLSENLS
jgi:hypothetical protein